MNTLTKNKAEMILKVKDLSDSIFTPEIMSSLDDIGFFDAPASSKHHECYPGGLCEHSLKVANILIQLTKDNGLFWERKESPAIIGILHDLCKCDQYILCEDGTYTWNKSQEVYGHGDKSLFVAGRLGFKLTNEELNCIRWHMGAFDSKKNWSLYTEAICKFKNVLWTHQADMLSVYDDTMNI